MTVVAIIGGGISAATLVGQLPGAVDHDRLDVRLAAQDLDRLAVIADHGRALVAGRTGWTVTACRSVEQAVAGADVVVVMVRVGGLAARRADEEMAWAHGIPGDEGLGPAGAANALRTLPVLVEMARHLEAAAPGATVLNMVAPLGLTTRVLLDHGVDATGVCELPAVTEAALVEALASTAPGRPVELAYAGLNHLGWFWPAASEAGAPPVDLAPLVAGDLVDPVVLDRFGAIPLKYYYWLFDTDAADRLGISRDAGRTAHLIALRDRAVDEMAAAPGSDSPALAGRPTPWFEEGLVPMLRAVVAGTPWSGFANVRNDGLVPEIGPDVVVEVRATIEGGRLRPTPSEETMPTAVRSFVDSSARAEDLIYRSWRDGGRDLLVDALVEGPHHIDPAAAGVLARAIRSAAEGPVGARA